jgi:hypothetical protein
MTTFIHEEMHRFALAAGSRDYDARIVVGFGVVMIAVATLVYAVVVGAGVDHTVLQMMSVFP